MSSSNCGLNPGSAMSIFPKCIFLTTNITNEMNKHVNDDVVLFQVASVVDGSHLWNYARALYNLISNSIAYKRF